MSNPTHLTLTSGDDHAPLPSEVVDVLSQALAALARDQAVTILPTATLLTTQQAADILGVSRPTIVKILEAGEIPFVTPGRHRRIQLADLVAYQQRSRQQTAEALDELMKDSAQYYLETASADDESAVR
ncbi:helix-turn-helix domain-containing protein [Nakamurella sp. A5-74]|uniref:Helix-turn-helix domain-containing protein n=1 Tax=Nakamurella sp. A5-74 TaxID=3158264 RepID=A0AAU8DJ55_9ACTN